MEREREGYQDKEEQEEEDRWDASTDKVNSNDGVRTISHDKDQRENVTKATRIGQGERRGD